MKCFLLVTTIALLATYIQTGNAIQLNCKFVTVANYPWGSIYECDATVVYDAQNVNRVTAVTGTHSSGKGNADVHGLRIQSQKLDHFLVNIHKFFPNLKLLYFLSTSIPHISNAHLLPLTNLEYLGLYNNSITSLESNLFAGFESIKFITFSNNKIKHVGLDFILPNTAHLFDFSKNPCIDMKAETPAQITELRQKLLVNCPPLNCCA
ncbi:leucine-rich repeat neuronal protein 3-like [Bradysia coprophila]|uniref:leucine-rich repeat neuronal protein 3-like n=1 Tax=Bradysia coprophila TaxID=38358 RepID=UPI00187DC8B2|nr:leucine-rich repeat neuronal protein 3-like [Bradysia coprophila]